MSRFRVEKLVGRSTLRKTEYGIVQRIRSAVIVCGVPDDLKKMPEVNPGGARRLDIECEHVMLGLQKLRRFDGVKSATVFGQSMHLLMEDTLTEDAIRASLAEAGITQADIRPIAPSLEDVFVALTSGNGGK